MIDMISIFVNIFFICFSPILFILIIISHFSFFYNLFLLLFCLILLYFFQYIFFKLFISKKFITNFEIANKRGTGIIFYGPYGVGKTHLACSIANELIKMQKSVVFGSTIKLFGIIKKSYNNEIQENESKIISEFINCDVLIIDDLGKEKPSEWVLEKLYYIINERYEHNKPIIITTNFTENQLIDIFTVGKNKSSIEAIMSRLNEICLTVKILDNDYRYKP